MDETIMQQIIISGVGGQGVLFVTRLLAEAAIKKRLAVFTSETHGMAQRGGTVLSHLKVGNFSSPLIRPAQADGLLALRAENLAQHGAFLKDGGWVIVNGENDAKNDNHQPLDTIDADTLAQEMGNPKAVNLIVLGFALAMSEKKGENRNTLFCSLAEIQTVLEDRFGKNQKMLSASLKALEAGYNAKDK
ncbi:MAG: indolepyruvate oxidoreductase subunit beta [Desulfobacterales bacterium]|jgi:indolepyruvate ferredoxin oxidoreductase beta subunit